MPNTREKLIELLAEHCDFKEEKCVGCDKEGKYYEPMCKTNLFGKIADHLIANGVTVQEWISVKDRLPEDGNERVLVKVDSGNILVGNPKIDTDRYYSGMWVRYGSHITHWMPLPQPPKGE